MWRTVIAAAMWVGAQTPHPCDAPLPVSGTAVIGQMITTSACVPPDALVGWVFYADGFRHFSYPDLGDGECFYTPRFVSVSPVTGLALYTYCQQAPIDPGVYTYQAAPITDTGEQAATSLVLRVTVAPPLPPYVACEECAVLPALSNIRIFQPLEPLRISTRETPCRHRAN